MSILFLFGVLPEVESHLRLSGIFILFYFCWILFFFCFFFFFFACQFILFFSFFLSFLLDSVFFWVFFLEVMIYCIARHTYIGINSCGTVGP